MSLGGSTMYVRRALLCALTSTVVGLTTLAADPAHAAPTTTISAVDTSSAGHARGTATTDAPYAYVVVLDGANALGSGYTLEPVVDGTVSFDVETWGLRIDRTYALRVAACEDASFAHCSPTDAVFTPSDVDPDITWPQDRALGPGEAAGVEVSDPMGGGWLTATWDQNDWSWNPESLRQGANALHAPEGRHLVAISRCGELGCRPTGQEAEFLVDQRFHPQAIDTDPRAVRPDDTPAPDATAEFYLEGADEYSLDWHLVDPTDGTTVPGIGGTVTGLATDAAGVAAVPLDLTGAPDGQFRLEGEFSYDSPDFGHVSAPATDKYLPRVDTVAPEIRDVRQTTRNFFPVDDEYHDEFNIAFDTDNDADAAQLRYVNTAGQVVLTQQQSRVGSYVRTAWKGTDADGQRVPGGRYRIQGTVRDEAGNETTQLLGTVTLSWKKKVSRRISVVVSARKSLLDQWTGRCSRIVKGGSRHWRDGLGLASNTSCSSNTWDGSGAATLHGVRAPRGWMSGVVAVDVYGGASTSRPSSLGAAELWSRRATWFGGHTLASRVGWHGYQWFDSDRLVQKSGWVEWRVAVADGQRYDVKEFRVIFEGTVLR